MRNLTYEIAVPFSLFYNKREIELRLCLYMYYAFINTFLANIPILYRLKIPENQIGQKWVK